MTLEGFTMQEVMRRKAQNLRSVAGGQEREGYVTAARHMNEAANMLDHLAYVRDRQLNRRSAIDGALNALESWLKWAKISDKFPNSVLEHDNKVLSDARKALDEITEKVTRR